MEDSVEGKKSDHQKIYYATQLKALKVTQTLRLQQNRLTQNDVKTLTNENMNLICMTERMFEAAGAQPLFPIIKTLSLNFSSIAVLLIERLQRQTCKLADLQKKNTENDDSNCIEQNSCFSEISQVPGSEFKKSKLGGVQLYNQNYTRYLEDHRILEQLRSEKEERIRKRKQQLMQSMIFSELNQCTEAQQSTTSDDMSNYIAQTKKKINVFKYSPNESDIQQILVFFQNAQNEANEFLQRKSHDGTKTNGETKFSFADFQRELNAKNSSFKKALLAKLKMLLEAMNLKHKQSLQKLEEQQKAIEQEETSFKFCCKSSKQSQTDLVLQEFVRNAEQEKKQFQIQNQVLQSLKAFQATALEKENQLKYQISSKSKELERSQIQKRELQSKIATLKSQLMIEKSRKQILITEKSQPRDDSKEQDRSQHPHPPHNKAHPTFKQKQIVTLQSESIAANVDTKQDEVSLLNSTLRLTPINKAHQHLKVSHRTIPLSSSKDVQLQSRQHERFYRSYYEQPKLLKENADPLKQQKNLTFFQPQSAHPLTDAVVEKIVQTCHLSEYGVQTDAPMQQRSNSFKLKQKFYSSPQYLYDPQNVLTTSNVHYTVAAEKQQKQVNKADSSDMLETPQKVVSQTLPYINRQINSLKTTTSIPLRAKLQHTTQNKFDTKISNKIPQFVRTDSTLMPQNSNPILQPLSSKCSSEFQSRSQHENNNQTLNQAKDRQIYKILEVVEEENESERPSPPFRDYYPQLSLEKLSNSSLSLASNLLKEYKKQQQISPATTNIENPLKQNQKLQQLSSMTVSDMQGINNHQKESSILQKKSHPVTYLSSILSQQKMKQQLKLSISKSFAVQVLPTNTSLFSGYPILNPVKIKSKHLRNSSQPKFSKDFTLMLPEEKMSIFGVQSKALASCSNYSPIEIKNSSRNLKKTSKACTLPSDGQQSVRVSPVLAQEFQPFTSDYEKIKKNLNINRQSLPEIDTNQIVKHFKQGFSHFRYSSFSGNSKEQKKQEAEDDNKLEDFVKYSSLINNFHLKFHHVHRGCKEGPICSHSLKYAETVMKQIQSLRQKQKQSLTLHIENIGCRLQAEQQSRKLVKEQSDYKSPFAPKQNLVGLLITPSQKNYVRKSLHKQPLSKMIELPTIQQSKFSVLG